MVSGLLYKHGPISTNCTPQLFSKTAINPQDIFQFESTLIFKFPVSSRVPPCPGSVLFHFSFYRRGFLETPPAPTPPMGSVAQATKRLNSELTSLILDPVPGVSAFPDGDDLLSWKSTIKGPDNSYYVGMEFSLHMQFQPNYPIAPPTVKFVTPIFHPNIDMSGNICLDILKDKWSPTYTVSTILLSIQSLLETPNNDSPLNNQAAQLWDNKTEFLSLAKKRYASEPLS